MPVHSRTFEFWLGRAGSGKTHAAIDAIASEAFERPRGRPLLLIVPEQASVQMEYALATRPGLTGFTRARVFSFKWLAAEVFKRFGGQPRHAIDEEARVMLLRQVIARQAKDLKLLGRSAERPGLAEKVGDTLTEFQRYGWRPEDLRDRIATLASEDRHGRLLEWKLADLLAIWRGYQEELEERGLADPAGLDEAAIGLLAEWDALAGAQVWVDGFASFTVTELRLLEALLAQAESAALCLTLDPARRAFEGPAAAATPTRPAGRRPFGAERTFENIERTHEAVRARVEGLGWHIRTVVFPQGGTPTRFNRSPELEHLESAALTRARATPFAAGAGEEERPCAERSQEAWSEGPIELAEAVDRRAEVEAVAARIASACEASPGVSERARWRYSEVVVLARDLTEYAPLVREIFPRYGVPFFLDTPRSVLGHPLARLLLHALDLIERDWRSESVMGYLKTGLSPMEDRDPVARLENLARRRRLNGSADWFDRERWSAPAGTEGARAERDPALEDLFALWSRAARPVRDLANELNRPGDRDAAAALWEFLSRLKVGERIQMWAEAARAEGDEEAAMIHGAAWEGTIRILERLHTIGLEGETNGAPRRALFGRLRRVVETGLATVQSGLIPPTLEQVLVGSAERSRPPAVKAAFVLGLADGEFPRAYEEDPMLGDRERRELGERGRELGPDSSRRFNHERYLAYMALTRASEYLFLSRPLVGADGRSLGPSSYFRAAEAAFPAIEVLFIESDGNEGNPRAPRLIEDWVSLALDTYHRARRGEDPAPLGRVLGGPHPAMFAELGDGSREGVRERIEATLGALRWPREARLSGRVARDFWMAEPTLPVTALESHGLCPFQFYARRMLRLERPRDPLPGPLELGQLRHYVLEALFEELGAGGELDWGEIDLARAERLAGDSARRGAESALADDFGRDPLTDSIVEFVAREMRYFVRALRAMGERYGFVQTSAEFRFGPNEQGKVMLAAGGGLSFALIGSIDRVDRAKGEGGAGPLLLFDYKSGRKGIDPTRLMHGIDLQLPAYALALERALGEKAPGKASARVAGVFYWPLSIGISTAAGEAWAEPGSEAWFEGHRPSGLFDDSIAGGLDTSVQPGQKALAFGFGLNRDGRLRGGAVGPLGPGAFRNLLAHVQGIMERRAGEIAEGRIAVHPWKDKKGVACDFCDYASLCRIGTYESDRFRVERRIKAREFGEKLEAGEIRGDA